MTTWSRLDELERLFSEGEPRSAYLFPELPGTDFRQPVTNDGTFVFQFWPETLEAAYTVRYGQKSPVGASHDLQQWTGGSGRDISFQTVFTAEKLDTGVEELSASGRYTVDVRAAASFLQSLMLGSYGAGQAGGLNNLAKPPKKLWLVLENTGLGGNKDEVLVVLKSAPVTYESWFPNGKPRIVVLSLTFAEIVQRSSAKPNASNIHYIGREVFEQDAQFYKYRGTVDRVMG